MKFISFLILLLLFNFTNAQTNCNNWFRGINQGDVINIGDLDITGNQITVEATFNRTGAFNGNLYSGDLVTKHRTGSDINYLLRPANAYITTTTGFYATPQTCDIQLNKTYHVAMVYNGTFLSFYRNGFLMNSVPATGNLITNNWNTAIGDMFVAYAGLSENFNGFINEVRIWNIARTQTEINTFMNTSLPNPTTQIGLQGYYVFDNLLNKQGNATYNGTIFGNATINTTNTNCTFVADSCCTPNTNTIVSKCSNQNIILNARTGTTYLWTPNTGLSATNIQNPICGVLSNTTYYVSVFNATTNCSNIDTVRVIVNPVPISNIKDTSICRGDTIQLNAPLGYTYSWSPNYNINNTTISNPKVWPQVNTSYVVTITNSAGCIVKDTVMIGVYECGCEDSCNWSKTGNTFVKSNHFIGSKNNADFKIRTNNIQRGVFAANGNVGINTFNPTAKLHVNAKLEEVQTNPSNIRFENLSVGVGNVLVIDKNGYVYKSTPPLLTKIQDDLNQANQEIKELKNQVVELYKLLKLNVPNVFNESVLYDCAPNPSSSITLLKYSLSDKAKIAFLTFTNVIGKDIKIFNLPILKGEGQLTFSANELGLPGVYFYTLVVDGKKVNTKKLIVE